MPPTNFPLRAIVTAQHTLDLPPEIKAQLIPGETYYIFIQDNTITLAKNPKFDWAKWRENVNRNSEELTDEIMDDICELVREARRDRKVEQEDQ
ncbi:MAG: hypothetical protein ACO37W_05570 [Prochlorotrichaceae cyanobacterium]